MHSPWSQARLGPLVIALVLSAVLVGWYLSVPPPPHALVLLLPNAQALGAPAARAWVEVAREEGLPLAVMTDDEFMRLGDGRRRVPGVILPDTVHRRASGLLVGLLEGYVESGGKLLLAYDAGVFDAQVDAYAARVSRLWPLAGVRYALYGELRDATLARGRVLATREAEARLRMRPGILDFPAAPEALLRPASAAPVLELKFARRLGQAEEGGMGALTGSGAVSDYSYFRTGDGTAIRVLMRSPRGDVLLGLHAFRRGEVLFANLPLGELKTRHDGYMLHRVLSWFGTELVGLPRLEPQPEGQAARSADRRGQTRWTLSEGDGETILRAGNPAGLEQLAWIIPAGRVRQIVVRKGSVDVRKHEGEWVVRAKGGTELELSLASR